MKNYIIFTFTIVLFVVVTNGQKLKTYPVCSFNAEVKMLNNSELIYENNKLSNEICKYVKDSSTQTYVLRNGKIKKISYFNPENKYIGFESIKTNKRTKKYFYKNYFEDGVLASELCYKYNIKADSTTYEREVEYYRNGNKYYWRNNNNLKEYYENGNIFLELHYDIKDNLLENKYYENGKLKYIYNSKKQQTKYYLENGILDGIKEDSIYKRLSNFENEEVAFGTYFTPNKPRLIYAPNRTLILKNDSTFYYEYHESCTPEGAQISGKFKIYADTLELLIDSSLYLNYKIKESKFDRTLINVTCFDLYSKEALFSILSILKNGKVLNKVTSEADNNFEINYSVKEIEEVNYTLLIDLIIGYKNLEIPIELKKNTKYEIEYYVPFGEVSRYELPLKGRIKNVTETHFDWRNTRYDKIIK